MYDRKRVLMPSIPEDAEDIEEGFPNPFFLPMDIDVDSDCEEHPKSNGQEENENSTERSYQKKFHHRQSTRRKIRHRRQKRLLLLQHSAQCTVVEGECSRTSQCADMKALWRHIERCEATDCEYAHCISSRYVLSHFHRCQVAGNYRCKLCAPVRKYMAKQKNAQNL
jgi:E1A/CREB-binding protein